MEETVDIRRMTTSKKVYNTWKNKINNRENEKKNISTPVKECRLGERAPIIVSP
jgi:hypothetical protein